MNLVVAVSVWLWLTTELQSTSDSSNNYFLRGEELETCPRRPSNPKLSIKRKCSKKCASDVDCKGKGKSCLCDGDCGLSCVNPALRCHALLDLPNGWVMHPTDYKFGSIARFGCTAGHKLVGPDERVCQGNREWSGPQPRCIPNVKCGPPPDVPYAKYDAEVAEEYELETLVKYYCVAGYYKYNTKGLARAKCLLYNNTARWFGPEIRCSPRACGNPGEILNGMREGELFLFGHTVNYRCVPGFVLQGSAIRKCLATGRWSGEEPSCRAVNCAKPPEPRHGKVLGSSLSYQSKISYQCEKGYKLVGPDQRTCQSDKTWSGDEPFCQEIRCPSLGPLWNGYIDGDKTTYGSTISFRCLEEMTFEGESLSSVCQKDGKWSHSLPRCLAACKVEKVANGQAKRRNVSELVAHSEAIEILCNKNYELNYPYYPRCQNGTWTPTLPSCVPIRCKGWPPPIKNGMVVFAKADHGSKAKYTCELGYSMSGNNKMECNFGFWTGSPPACNEQLCRGAFEEYGRLPAGKIMLEGTMGTYEYTEYVRHLTHGRLIKFECGKGYTLKEFCSHPLRAGSTIANGRVLLEGSMGVYEYKAYISPVGYGRIVQFSCQQGYIRRGPPKATCIEGKWQPQGIKPECKPQEFPPIEDRIIWERKRRSISTNITAAPHPNPCMTRRHSLHGQNRLSRRCNSAASRIRTRAAKAEISQDIQDATFRRKMKKVGRTFREKLMKGCWNGRFCPPVYDTRRQLISYIVGGPLKNGSIPVGTEIQIECVRGYELSDPTLKFIRCREGGWLPAIPRCLPKNCNLPSRENAFYMYLNEIVAAGLEIRHSYGAQMFCLKEYELHGNDILECNLGQFLKPVGQCVPKPCPLPYLRYGQYLLDSIPEKILHGMRVDFNCSESFRPNPEPPVVYCWFGNFRPETPMCNPVEVIRTGRHRHQPILLYSGCDRPMDVESAWIYRELVAGNRTVSTLIDPDQSVFPNQTVVHYKCLKPNVTNNHEAMQANAVKCVNGDWIAQLFDCAPMSAPPAGVQTNSSLIVQLQHVSNNNAPCRFPNLTHTVQIVDQLINGSDNQIDSFEGYPHGTRLKVKCLYADDEAEESLWTIRCRRGKWRKINSVKCDGLKRDRDRCSLFPENYRDIFFFDYHQGLPLLNFEELLPDGTRLGARCTHEGLFKFTGSRELKCIKGSWSGLKPSCQPLGNFGKNLDLKGSSIQDQLSLRGDMKNAESPPAITYYAEQGDVTQLNSGKLNARISSTIHLDCILPKRKGQPKWLISNSYRNYPSGWTEVLLQHVDDHSNQVEIPETVDAFRLSIYSGRPEDSGIYSCISPAGLRHSLVLNVSDVECPFIEAPPHTKLDFLHPERKFWVNSIVQFHCSPGYNLRGTTRVYCLETANWSHSTPTCVPVSCPPITLTHVALKVNLTSLEYGGIATFNCSTGFSVDGPQAAFCIETGKWSDEPPTCRDVTCNPPDVPNGAEVEPIKSSYLHGDLVLYKCQSGYIMQGNPASVCNDLGVWSNPAPECFAVCWPPSRPVGTRLNSRPKAYYYIGEKIVYYCTDPRNLRLSSHPVLECTKSGWSKLPPDCVERKPTDSNDPLESFSLKLK